MDAKFDELVGNLSDDLKAKVVNCKTPEDLIALAQSENVTLNDEQLEAINGGKWGDHGDWGCTTDEDPNDPC